MDNLNLQTTLATSPQNFQHHSKSKYLIFGVISLILILSVGLSYLFWWVPRVQAKEYLEAISQDYLTIHQKINLYTDGFNPLSESFLTSREAFFEITTSRSYDDARVDTKQDIEDINSTLKLVDEAKQTKQNILVPQDFISLDQALDSYYQNIEQGLKLLLEVESLQMKMLDASGQQLQDELKKVDSVIKVGAARQDLIEYFSTLDRLTSQSIQEFEKIKDIPQIHQKYYDFMLEYHTDLVATTRTMVSELSKKTEAGDEAMLEELLAMLERTKLRNQKRENNSRQFLEQSPIKNHFQTALTLESQIKNQLEDLSNSYGVRVRLPSSSPVKTIPTEATHSAESSPSAESSASGSKLF